MPRRSTPDPLAAAVGRRIRDLRVEAGLTLEKLAYESELGSKGHLSDIERGLTRPTIQSLKVLADHLNVELLDLVTFPGASSRQELVDLTRRLSTGTVRSLLEQARAARRALGGAGSDPGTRASPARRRSRDGTDRSST